ncbi:MAG TPA: HAD family hydrolase [Gaiellaceae bacterium]|nr:HAD family hydrolase [Gaiellaceae bacterium]
MRPARLLVLFDLDGTLFLTDDPLLGRALRETLRECYGVELPQDAIERVDHAGQTSLRIGRLVLRAAGLDDPTIDAALGSWCARFAARYLELLAGADTSGWRAAPDAAEALARLVGSGLRVALLTGNPEPVARARLERLGLGRFFPPKEGAFGCEAESRAELIDLARARAGDWPRAATVEVGDTGRDAASARSAGVRSILVGPAGARAGGEGDADAVCADLREAATRLLAWAG